ncbi:hypothetical protein ACFWJT_02585 [Streptomyces sp. NPDC127069]|uniref:hypothetical protein n=1 Tax=Streptomyces sp. NPDC127069 TaxID=3347128 RepID=UPI0036666928
MVEESDDGRPAKGNDRRDISEATLRGFLREGAGAGRRRLQFTMSSDYYADFAAADVADITVVDAEGASSAGGATVEVTLKPGAAFAYPRSRATEGPDEFDLDLRHVARSRTARGGQTANGTNLAEDATEEEFTCGGTCQGSCQDDDTCAGDTCEGTCDEWTCGFTNCNQLTCQDEDCEETATLCTDCETCLTCEGGVTCPHTGDCMLSEGWTDPNPCHGPSEIESVCVDTCHDC